MRQEVRAKTELAPFELKLPPPFNVEPAFTVELPAKHKALIFDKIIDEQEYNQDGKQVTVHNKGWHVFIINSIGNHIHRSRYEWDENLKTTDPLKIQFYLKTWALNLTKSKKTTVEVNETDE